MGLGSLTDRIKSFAVHTVKKVETAVEQKVEAVKAKVTAVPDAFVSPPAASPVASPVSSSLVGSSPSLSLDALKRALGTVSGTFSGPNTTRALATEADLAKLKLTNPRNMGALDDDIHSALVRGVATRRTDSDRGQTGILGQAQAHRAGETVMGMTTQHHGELKALMSSAGTGADGKPAAGADADAERALILKAIAARKDALTGDDVDKASAAMKEVSQFANDIRGMPREKLIRSTTSLDIDNQNTSAKDVDGKADGATDNDGFTQKFENSCVATVGQMVRAENDPAYALALNREEGGLSAINPESASGKDQSWILRNGDPEKGNVPVTRQEFKDRQALLKQIDSSGFSALEKKVLTNHLKKDPAPLNPTEQRTLDAVLPRFKANAKLTDEQLARFKAIDGEGGMTAQSGASFGAKLGYNEHEFDAKSVSSMQKLASQGTPVPILIQFKPPETGGHQMLITDARDGKLLVSDPYSGKTAWVKERDFKDGTFAAAQFNLPNASVSHFYDQ